MYTVLTILLDRAEGVNWLPYLPMFSRGQNERKLYSEHDWVSPQSSKYHICTVRSRKLQGT